MASILAQIEGPTDVAGLSLAEMEQLAQELRTEILRTVAANGGHLAANLGVVELTIALHAVFRSPHDKIIWDVGHQVYAHKLLTGRRELFPTLRTWGGLSGFPKRKESPHDPVETGHSSTSISAALGFAVARDLAGEDYDVVAVIGDGAIGGGMAFEALNHAGELGTNLLVILNDNEMSIAPNVGALADYLNRLRTDPTLSRVRDDIEFLVKKLPAIGPTMAKVVERVKDSVKYLVVPGMLFEQLGFTYFGPVDGHQLGTLLRAIRDARTRRGPVLLHVLTRKGKGYPPAEREPEKFHGIGPFALATGELLQKGTTPTYTEVFSRTLVDLAAMDERICAITAAMPEGTGLDAFARAYPQRYFNVGIAEEHAVTFAAGLAANGLRPVVALYSTFLQRAYDQIIHDVCLPCLPVVFAVDRAGLVGEDGPTHQGIFDLSFLRHIPNLVLMSPRDERELQLMLKTALSLERPVAVRYPRGNGTGAALLPSAQLKPLPLGEAEELVQGEGVAILALGSMVEPACVAARELEREEGWHPTVLNLRFLKPLPAEQILFWARRTRRLVTAEENVLAGGCGSAVLELLADAGLTDVKVVRLGLPDQFCEQGPVDVLRKEFGLSVDNIKKAVRTCRR